jgi:HSP20 family molecular chaperone IbpA
MSQRIEIQRADELKLPADLRLSGVPVNVYRSSNYVCVDIGLPRCRASQVRLTLASDGLLVETRRHAAEGSAGRDRRYVLYDLPGGQVRRRLEIPMGGLSLDDASAHFANGMLIVNIPTRERAQHRRAVRAARGAGAAI